jgi:hypothetical protein
MSQVGGAYPRFVARCEDYRGRLEAKLGKKMNPRELDKVLLAVDRKL